MKTKEEMREYKREWSRKKYNRTQQSLKNSTTWVGRMGEILALEALDGSIDMNKDAMNNPGYDLIWNDKKVDVKICSLYKRKKHHNKITNIDNISGWWVFNKNKYDADLYFCICLKNNKPVRYYLIPAKDFSNGITIGQRSEKFDKYIIKKYE